MCENVSILFEEIEREIDAQFTKMIQKIDESDKERDERCFDIIVRGVHHNEVGLFLLQ